MSVKRWQPIERSNNNNLPHLVVHCSYGGWFVVPWSSYHSTMLIFSSCPFYHNLFVVTPCVQDFISCPLRRPRRRRRPTVLRKVEGKVFSSELNCPGILFFLFFCSYAIYFCYSALCTAGVDHNAVHTLT